MAGLGLPLPKSGAEIVDSGIQGIFDQMRQRQLLPYQLELLKAQAQEAQGAGAKSQYLAKLIKQVTDQSPAGSQSVNSGQPGSNVQGANPHGGMGVPEKAAILAALMGIPTTSQVIDGKLVTNNPFTGIQQTQVGQTPEQKAALDVKTKTEEKQNADNAAKADQAYKDAQSAIELGKNYKALSDLLEKDPKHHLTGVGKGLFIQRTRNPDASTFNAKTSKELVALEKQFSQRGSNLALSTSKLYKPDIGASYSYNRGNIDNGFNDTREQYKTAKENYHRATGQSLPISYDEFEKAEKIESGGGKHSLVNKESNEATDSDNNSGNNPVVVVYRKDRKTGKVREYHLPPKLHKQALAEGAALNPEDAQ